MKRDTYTILEADALRYKAAIERLLDRYAPPAGSPMARWLWRLGEIRAGRQSPLAAMQAAACFAREGRLDLALLPHLALADFILAGRLAHAVEVLEQHASRIDVDASARSELCEQDHKKLPASEAMPSGVESFVLAGIIAESGEGRVRVAGTGSKGTDLHWTTPDGLVRTERKDRAFSSAFQDTGDGILKWVGSKVVDAIRKFPTDDPETPRVVVVGAALPLPRARLLYGNLEPYLWRNLGDYVRKAFELPVNQHAATRVPEAVCAHVAAISKAPEEMTSFQEISNAPRAAHVPKLRNHLRRVFDPARPDTRRCLVEKVVGAHEDAPPSATFTSL